jgi:predicted ATPase/DNA-binding winged helix-turn-helix (wHTH) protein
MPRFERAITSHRLRTCYNQLEADWPSIAMNPETVASTTVEFGRFRVLSHRRELFADNRPVELGARAFDVLMALIEARGAVVSKDALMERVWPDRVVEENNLAFQISALRKAFASDRGLIRTVFGRGYQFTGVIRTVLARPDEQMASGVPRPTPLPSRLSTNLPASISELIGRAVELGEILELSASQRLVTLAGTGGIGKTRLGFEAARHQLPRFADGVWAAELALLSDPDLVPVTVATALGLELASGTASPQSVADALRSKQLMLVLDNCEHVIDAAARMAEALLRANPTARVIATSREPLRAEDEWVFWVPPLAVPPEDSPLGEDPLRYGAVRLFGERARAAAATFAHDARSVAKIAEICRRLDGIPLAIELAAARVAVLGLEALSVRLDDRFRLLTTSRRTALPRHQTLRATLDWSYELLTEHERVVLHRLAIFAGSFTLGDTQAVAGDEAITATDVVNCVASLVAKSLLTVDDGGAMRGYRLLETTRTYALEKLVQAGEFDAVARRHARRCLNLFEGAEAEVETRPTDEWVAEYVPRIDNLRAALDWAFSPGSDASIGLALTAAAVPLWMHLSLMDECSRRTGKAIAGLAFDDRGTRGEMLAQFGLGFSTMVIVGVADRALKALTRALELAEIFHHPQYQLRALASLCIFQLRLGEFRSALAVGRRCEAVANGMTDPVAIPTAARLLGASLCLLGDHDPAQVNIQRALESPMPGSERRYVIRFGPDHRANALAILATNRWLQGFPEQAQQASRLAIEEVHHHASLCLALFVGGGLVCRWSGDLTTAERLIAELIAQTERHSFGPYHGFGLAMNGILIARRGDPVAGANLLRAALDRLHEAQYFIYHAMFLTDLADVLSSAGRAGEGLVVIEETLDLIEQNGAFWYLPEALRIKGELLLLQQAQGAAASAEDHFQRALDHARRQGALSWELRAATSLARLWHDQARGKAARELLAPVYDRFTEGFATADLKVAMALLDILI